MTSNKKNILLVGGAGYIGSYLANMLASSYDVVSTSRSSHKSKIQLEFLDKNTYPNITQVKKYDLIIVLASTLQGIGTTELREEYLEGNTTGLASFLQFLSDNKLCDKLIYISSMAVYGINNKMPVREDAVLEPISTYGLSKKLAEQIFDFYCKSTKMKGAILRIPGVYGGSRKSGFIYNASVKCKRNEPIEINTSTLGFWETIHVDDLCGWIKEFISNYDWHDNTDIFNLNYGVPTDIIDCAYKIKNVLKSSSDIKVTGEKGYIEFYLDNNKIKKYVNAKNSYVETLERYVLNLSV